MDTPSTPNRLGKIPHLISSYPREHLQDLSSDFRALKGTQAGFINRDSRRWGSICEKIFEFFLNHGLLDLIPVGNFLEDKSRHGSVESA